MYFSTFLLLTAAFNVDSSVGTFSESIPRKADRLLTLISADSGWFCNLLVLEPLLGVSFRTVFPFTLRDFVPYFRSLTSLKFHSHMRLLYCIFWSMTSLKFRSHKHVLERFSSFKGYEWWLFENLP